MSALVVTLIAGGVAAGLMANVRAQLPNAPTDPVGVLGAVRALKDKF